MKAGRAGDESVWWSNTRHMLKAYLKGAEMLKHGKASDEFIVDWCQRNGVVRVEVELKRRMMREAGLEFFGEVTDARLAELFEDHTQILRRVDRSDQPDFLAAVPPKYRMTAAAWLAGQDVRALLPERTLYRHAKVLRDCGIDILATRNVEAFPLKVRVVDLQPLMVPDWYQLERVA